MKKTLTLFSSLLCTGVVYGNDLNINAEAEAHFTYLDAIDATKLSLTTQRNTTTTDSLDSSTRTLGLNYFALSLHLRHKDSSFYINFRPDANLRRNGEVNSLSTEWDSRSGDVYQAAPSIRLLDLYELRLLDTDSYLFSYGVFDRVENYQFFYSNRMEFGLRPQFPRKYSALKFSWKTNYDDPNTSLEKGNYSGYHITVMTLENTNDRHEKLTKSDHSDDLAPSSLDPYTGGALVIKWINHNQSTLSLFSGYLDSKVDFGKKNQLLASIAGQTYLKIDDSPLLISYESRFVKERWTISEGRIPEVEQISHQLELTYPRSQWEKLFLSFAIGTSERPIDSNTGNLATHRGQQLVLGYQKRIFRHLALTFLLSDETREKEEFGIKSGGFSIHNTDEKRLNRIALEISYQSNWNFD